jgi:hypothetical protein
VSFLNSWFGGHFIYLGEWEDVALRCFGVFVVYLFSQYGLSFCVIPILIVIWIMDWRALPAYLWRYEGKEATPTGKDKKGQTSNGLATLLAPCYSVSGIMPAFEHSDMTSGSGGGDGKGEKRTMRSFYGLSLAFLACYVYACWWRCPDKVPLAIMNCVAMLVADSVHFSITGPGSAIMWSPGFRISLRTTGRLCVAFAGARYWLVGYAAMFAVYAAALVGEVLDGSLPHMDDHVAAGIIFFGHDAGKRQGLGQDEQHARLTEQH